LHLKDVCGIVRFQMRVEKEREKYRVNQSLMQRRSALLPLKVKYDCKIDGDHCLLILLNIRCPAAILHEPNGRRYCWSDGDLYLVFKNVFFYNVINPK
jgi:hypothetical protein